jgi:hypothetical protein
MGCNAGYYESRHAQNHEDHGRQGKSGRYRSGACRWMDWDFLVPIERPLLSLHAENSMISTFRATAALPMTAECPFLLVLFQYDNYMP